MQKIMMVKIKLVVAIFLCIVLAEGLILYGVDKIRYQIIGDITVKYDGGECNVGAVSYVGDERFLYKEYNLKSDVKNNHVKFKMSGVGCSRYKYVSELFLDGKKTTLTIVYTKHNALEREKFTVDINITKSGENYDAELVFDYGTPVQYSDIINNPIEYYTGP